MMGEDDIEDTNNSTYTKFKTQHEIDFEELHKYAPPIPPLDYLDDIIPFGKVHSYVSQGSGLVLISPKDISQIYDLDNIIALSTREIIGFVLDLVGPVTHPLYSVMLYPSFIDSH